MPRMCSESGVWRRQPGPRQHKRGSKNSAGWAGRTRRALCSELTPRERDSPSTSTEFCARRYSRYFTRCLLISRFNRPVDKVVAVIIPTSQKRKPKHTAVQQFARANTARQSWNRDLNRLHLASESTQLPSVLFCVTSA